VLRDGLYFFSYKKLNIVGRYNCLRSPYFVGDKAQLLSHITETLIFDIFFALACVWEEFW